MQLPRVSALLPFGFAAFSRHYLTRGHHYLTRERLREVLCGQNPGQTRSSVMTFLINFPEHLDLALHCSVYRGC